MLWEFWLLSAIIDKINISAKVVQKVKITVIGAGAMGSMLGAYLEAGGADVTLIVRHKELVEKFISPGITIQSYAADGQEASGLGPIPVKAAVDTKEQDVADAVLLMVKGPDTRDALAGAANIIGENTKVITLQNGIGNTDIIAESVPKDRIYYGCLNMSAIMEAPGVLTGALFGDVNVCLGSVEKGAEQKAFGDELCGYFKNAGVGAEYLDTIDVEVWNKMLVNLAVNATCGIVRLRGGEAGENNEFVMLGVDMIKEAIAVAHKLGVELDLNYFMGHVLPSARKTSGLHYPSMAQDMMMKKARTEIEFLNGAIERLGKEVGVPTPVNTTVARLVRTIESNYDRQYFPKGASGKTGPSFKITINDKFCKGCGYCVKYCAKNVLALEETINAKGYHVAYLAQADQCVGCLNCSSVCPEAAISITKED